MRIDILNEAEQRDDGDIRVAFVEHLVRVGGDEHSRLDAELREIADIHADDVGIDIDRADDLGALGVQVAQNIL